MYGSHYISKWTYCSEAFIINGNDNNAEWKTHSMGAIQNYTSIKIPVSFLMQFFNNDRSLEFISFPWNPREPHSLHLSYAVTGVVTATKRIFFYISFHVLRMNPLYLYHLQLSEPQI